MIRSSNASSNAAFAHLFIACALAGCAGCSGGRGLAGDTDRRRPDAVAIDPVSSPPPARDYASSTDGLVTLRTPLGVDRAISAVDELFRKIVIEDGEGLERLFTSDALAISTAGSGVGPGQTPSALPFWQQRFKRLDYTRLSGELVFRADEMEIFRASDRLDVSPHPAIRLEALHESDVVIRLPILTPRIGTERLFGDEMIFWLRRDNDRYRIYRILEDFQLS
jgi:hypothetical protein